MYSSKAITLLCANFIISRAQAGGGQKVVVEVGQLIFKILKGIFENLRLVFNIFRLLVDLGLGLQKDQSLPKIRQQINIKNQSATEIQSMDQIEPIKFLKLILMLILIFSFVFFIIWKSKNERNPQTYAGYVSKTKATCILNFNQKKQLIDNFKQKKWRIEYSLLKKHSQIMSCQMKLSETKFTDIYQICINGEDPIGRSCSSGVLYLQNNKICLTFQKVYNDKIKAGQTGSFTDLIYKGQQQGDQFYGQWYYKGHESDPKFSGNWKMLSQKQIAKYNTKAKGKKKKRKNN